MATRKTPVKSAKDAPDSDFTFQEVLTGIIRFNDKNVLLINFDTSAGKVNIIKLDDKTGSSKSGTITLS